MFFKDFGPGWPQDTLHGLWCTPPFVKGLVEGTLGEFWDYVVESAHHETLYGL